MTTSKHLFLLLVLLCASQAFASDLPDPRQTPGATNPDVTQQNIRSTICVRGFTKTIRPPMYWTNSLKKKQIRQFGYADSDPRHYEEDHLVALSIGGAPSDERNLWPQPRNTQWGADQKDQLEFVMYKMVCTGELQLAQAQQAMASNWIAAYQRYIPMHPNWHYSGGSE